MDLLQSSSFVMTGFYDVFANVRSRAAKINASHNTHYKTPETRRGRFNSPPLPIRHVPPPFINDRGRGRVSSTLTAARRASWADVRNIKVAFGFSIFLFGLKFRDEFARASWTDCICEPLCTVALFSAARLRYVWYFFLSVLYVVAL